MSDHPLLLIAQADPPPADAPPATTGDPLAGAPGTPPTATGEAASGDPSAPPPQADPGGGFFGGPMIWVLLLVFVIVIFFSSWSQKKERKKHQALIAQIKKGSRVRTAGGILGTVVDTRDTEVTLKVDENSNTRLRVLRTAIAAVVDEPGEAESGSSTAVSS